MKKFISFLVGGLLAASAGLVVGAAFDSARDAVDSASAARAAKVTICHRTNSVTNPYRRITVSSNSFNRNNGHSRHDGLQSNAQYPPFDPSFTYPNNAKNWGDIIPGATNGGSAFNGSNSFQQNWTTAGQSFLLDSGANRALCGKMTAKEFYDVEVAAGTPPSEILADLQDQSAGDDEALKSACGGNFTTCSVSVSSWTTAVSATTQAPTSLTGSGGTLNGELRCGTAATTRWYFEYSTDSTFATGVTEAPATPGLVTANPQTVSQVVTGLGAGSYYYRLVCVTNFGDADNVGYLEGNVMILGVAVPYITTTSLADGLTGTAYTETIQSEGGTAPRGNYLVSAGSLPNGLSLATNGQITGTPTATGLFTLSVTVRDSAGTPVTSAPKQLTIRIRQPQTVTIPDPSPKNYGDSPFAAGATSNVTADNFGNLGSFTSYSSSTTSVCTISSSGQITLVGAGPCTVSAVHSGNYLWDSGTGSRTFTVGTKAITVTAANKSKVVNGTDPTPSYTITVGSLVGSDAVSGLTYEYSGNGHSPVSSVPNVAFPTYAITPSAVTMTGGRQSNYTISYVAGVLNVSASAAAQTIDFADPADKTYGDVPFAITATSKDGGSNTDLEIVFTSQTPSVCTVGTESLSSGVTSVTVTALAAGTCTIEASQPGGSNGATTYSAATPVTQSIDIARKPLTITAADKSKVVDASNPTFSFTTSGLVGSDAVASVTYTFSSSSYTASTTVPNVAGSFAIAPSAAQFSSGVAANYTITYVNGTLTVTAVAPTPTAAPTTTVAPTTTTTTPSKATDPRKTTTDPFANIKIDPKSNKSGGGGTLTIDGDPAMDVLDASSNDPTVEVDVTKSGVEYNKPETWVAEGFGDECWKIEPGTNTYTLPAAPQNPSGRAGVYSLVKVKAGSLTSIDPNFQVNTVFMAPSAGSVVWPDSNKNGIIDSGGKNGDKQISHVILCVRYSDATGATSTTVPSSSTAPSSTAPSSTVPGSGTTVPGTTSPSSTTGPATTIGTGTTLPKDAPDIDGKRDDIIIRLRTVEVTGSTVPKKTVITLRLSSAFEERTVELTVNPQTMEVQKVVALSEPDAVEVSAAIAATARRGATASDALPATGSSGSMLMAYVWWLLGIGGATVVLGRRLRRRVR